MPFVVLPALIPDITAVYDVYFAAFHTTPITQALFPGATTEDFLNANSEFRRNHTSHVEKFWQRSSTQYTLKCIDTESGQIVGMALWDVYPTPSDWKPGDICWLSGQEKERAEALVSPLWEARKKYWDNACYVYCHVTAVHPAFQRRGIGKQLTDFGIRIAAQAQLPIYLESSKEGFRLYKKLGFRKLKDSVIHRAEVTREEEDARVPLMLYVPQGAEANVPAIVEFSE